MPLNPEGGSVDNHYRPHHVLLHEPSRAITRQCSSVLEPSVLVIEALEHDSRMLCSCATLMVYPLTGILTSGCCLSRASRRTATALRCISNTAAPTRFAVKIVILSLTPIAKYGPKGVVRGRITEETEETGE